MADNIIVKPGVSGQPVKYDTSKVKLETVADELCLLSLGDWEGLKDKINIDDSIDFDSLATLFDCDEINTDDGIKFSWSKKWIHIRKSNTEPIIRIFAEAKTESEVTDLIQTLKDYLK